MQIPTAIVVVAVIFLFSATSAMGPITEQPAGEGELTELWVSTPPPNLASNHHTPAVLYSNGEAFIAVPLNSRQGTLCKLSMLNSSGSEQWNQSVHEQLCTVHAYSDPEIADFNGDTHPEVLVATTEEVFVTYNLSTGAQEFRHNLTSLGFSQPMVVNFTSHPGHETIVVDLLGGVFVFRPTGEVLWTKKFGDARVRSPAVKDFDADGTPELAIGQLRGAVVVLEPNGTTAWRTNFTEQISVKWMTTGQLDEDSPIEIVIATITGHIIAVDGKTGAIEWTRDLASPGAAASEPSTALHTDLAVHGIRGASVRAVGDGDGDGQVEVYAADRDGALYSLGGNNGSIEWTTTLTTQNVNVAPPPVFGDIDGNGARELIAVDYTGQVSVIEPKTGNITASYKRNMSINTFPRIADITGDGVPEIIIIYDDGSVVALSYQSGEDVKNLSGHIKTIDENELLQLRTGAIFQPSNLHQQAATRWGILQNGN